MSEGISFRFRVYESAHRWSGQSKISFNHSEMSGENTHLYGGLKTCSSGEQTGTSVHSPSLWSMGETPLAAPLSARPTLYFSSAVFLLAFDKSALPSSKSFFFSASSLLIGSRPLCGD